MNPGVHRNSPTILFASQCNSAKPRGVWDFLVKVYFSLGIYLQNDSHLDSPVVGCHGTPEDKACALRHRRWMDPRPKQQTREPDPSVLSSPPANVALLARRFETCWRRGSTTDYVWGGVVFKVPYWPWAAE